MQHSTCRRMLSWGAVWLTSLASMAWAETEILERSTSPAGVQIRETSANATSEAAAQPGTRKNAVNVDKMQIQAPNSAAESRNQGAAKLDATARQLSTVSSGDENTATNVVGSIGGR